MSATGHNLRRRSQTADQVIAILGSDFGELCPRFLEAAGLDCEPNEETVREAVAQQSDYPAMLRLARQIAGHDDVTVKITIEAEVDVKAKVETVSHETIDADGTDDAAAPTPEAERAPARKPVPRKRAARKTPAKKGSGK